VARLLSCLLLCLALSACGSKSGAGMCGRASTLDDGRPGACRGARTALVCQRPDGFGCICAADGRGCPGCDPNQGSICREECRSDEYSVNCGPGGEPPPDGAIVIVYDDPPPTCRVLDLGVGLPSIYCCACQ
jgi:hypothetical protein